MHEPNGGRLLRGERARWKAATRAQERRVGATRTSRPRNACSFSPTPQPHCKFVRTRSQRAQRRFCSLRRPLTARRIASDAFAYNFALMQHGAVTQCLLQTRIAAARRLHRCRARLATRHAVLVPVHVARQRQSARYTWRHRERAQKRLVHRSLERYPTFTHFSTRQRQHWLKCVKKRSRDR